MTAGGDDSMSVPADRVARILGLRPLDSVLDAEWMANEMPGSQIPEGVLERMRRAKSPEAASAEGIAIARDLYASLKGRVQGVLVSAVPGRIGHAVDILE
jgi:5,10-methylenetetrahydrofolate reductase